MVDETNKETIGNVLDSLIANNDAQAQVHFHEYMKTKLSDKIEGNKTIPQKDKD